MDFLSLKAGLRQELKLTPQILQSMEVLQMSSQELREYLARVTEENPVLDAEEPVPPPPAYEAPRQNAGGTDAGNSGAAGSREERRQMEPGRLDSGLESLSAFLCDQLERRRLPGPLLALAKYLVGLLNEDGYLAEEDLEGLAELRIPPDLIARALDAVHSLEPAGVGARNLSECLLLQLERKTDAPPFAAAIAARFLPELGRKHYGPIARELGLTVEEIQLAERVISALEPRPGRAFQAAEPVAYVRPDVFIVEEDGELRVVLNEYELPRISINAYYTRLLRDADEQETRDYLREKLRQARWLLNCLERRGSTLRLCAEEILAVQRTFFTGETTELSPMGLSTLADKLGLHPSTVSRAVRGKYLQCRQGTYPLRCFFSRAVGEQGVSRQAVKQKLLRLVKAEDPAHPLSDQALCELLSGDGVEVARRTVAKYRMELGIGASGARKRRP